jgi:hypothetical protein
MKADADLLEFYEVRRVHKANHRMVLKTDPALAVLCVREMTSAFWDD